MTCCKLAKRHFYLDLSLTLFLLYIPITIYYVRNYEIYITFIPKLIERIDIQRSIKSKFLLCTYRRSISLNFKQKKKKKLTSNITRKLPEHLSLISN